MILDGCAVQDADDRSEWPWTVPAIAQLADEGLEFRAPITVIVGENGTGKSTLVEAIAEAYGADVRGGHTGRRYASALEPGVLSEHVRLRPGRDFRSARHGGYFMRAETAKGVLEYMTGLAVPGYGDRLAEEESHGEGFLAAFQGRFIGPGLYLLDEPESALSFTSCLALLAILGNVSETGGQVICATHSPVLAAAPGADIVQLDADGFHRSEWKDLEMVLHWRRFLDEPQAYLRQL